MAHPGIECDASMSAPVTKIQQSDLDEGFGQLYKIVKSGICCLHGCGAPACLVNHDRSIPPYLCRAHLSDGSNTHFGEWVPTGSPYYEKWSCCGTTWKLCRCNKLEQKFMGLPISVTTEQEREADAETTRLLAQQDESERWERMINAGREEAYDR
jgi:hypothetical protein